MVNTGMVSKVVCEPVKPAWTPPADGWLKLNIDAAFSDQTGAAAWGGVLRDHLGLAVAFVNGPFPACGDATVAEARACLTGLRSLIQFIDKPVILASDNSGIVQELNSQTFGRSATAQIVRDIQAMSSILPGLSFQKEPRLANTVAHELARLSRDGFGGGGTLGPVPLSVLRVYEMDSSGLGPDLL